MPELLSFHDHRPLIGLSRDYRNGELFEPHAHDRAQLLYGRTGLVLVSTHGGTWMMPPDRGLWIPAGQIHEVRMIGAVQMRSLYIRPEHVPEMPDHCTVLSITDLMRTLVVEACLLAEPPAPPARSERDLALVHLLLCELPRLAAVPLMVPMPAHPRLRALCEQFLADPETHVTIEHWCRDLNTSRRSFTRLFRAETGLSFGDWRRRACIMAAIPRLLAGDPVTAVAFDLGYDNSAAFSTMFRRITGEAPSRYSSLRGVDSAKTPRPDVFGMLCAAASS